MLPYCSDQCHPEDTLFLVAEPDYTVRKEDEEARAELLEAVSDQSLGAHTLEEMLPRIGSDELRGDFEAKRKLYNDLQAARCSGEEVLWPYSTAASSGSSGEGPQPSSKPIPGQATEPKAATGQKRSYSGERTVAAPQKPTKPAQVSVADTSEELRDIIYYCNEAARAGVGDLIWLAWNSHHWKPKTKSSTRRSMTPQAGAHLYALTAKGARFLLDKRVKHEFSEGHMGSTLAHLLKTYQKDFKPEFGACFLCPPVGNFIAHPTTTNENVRVLPSHWDESWCQGGTRKDNACGHWYDRDLCHITERGNPEVITTVQPNDDFALWWKTKAHCEHPEKGIGVQFWHRAPHLQDRGSAYLCR